MPILTPEVAIDALSALAHSGRLAVFRLLVKAGPDGMAAGDVARAMDTAPNTMSTQLAILTRTGLIRSQRDRRSIIYRADYDAFSALLAFLIDDCCDGRPEICTPLVTVVQTALACAADAC